MVSSFGKLIYLVSTFITFYLTQASDVTFSSCPRNCTCGVPHNSDGFSNRGSQEQIDCSGNVFTEIPYWDIPCDATIIKFTGNKIRKLTRTDFRGLQQLQEIYLDRNQIDYIEAETFAGLPNLRSVNLGGNKFTEIDERPFWAGKFSGSLTVELGSNPFDCDIELRRTVEEIRHKVDLAGIICAEIDRRKPVIRRNRKLTGRPYDDVDGQIRRRKLSWQIGLIASACWVFFWACFAAGYFCYTYDDGNVRKKYTRQLTSAREITMSKARSINNKYGGTGRIESEEEYEMDPSAETYREDPRYYYSDPYDDPRSRSPNRSMSPNMMQHDSNDPRFVRDFQDDREFPNMGYRTAPMENHHRMSLDPRENPDESHLYSLPNRGTPGRYNAQPSHSDSVREQEYFPNRRGSFQRKPLVEEYSADAGRPMDQDFEMRVELSGGRPGGEGGNDDDEFDI